MRTITSDPNQPLDGVAVPDDTPEAEIEILRRTYDSGDRTTQAHRAGKKRGKGRLAGTPCPGRRAAHKAGDFSGALRGSGSARARQSATLARGARAAGQKACRVLRHALDEDLEMQVRAGRAAGVAELGDRLSPLDQVAGLDQ